MTKEKSLQDIQDIKDLMNKSTRFDSISGVSGILAGIFALFGAFLGRYLIDNKLVFKFSFLSLDQEIVTVAFVLLMVLLVSIISLLFLTFTKAQKNKTKVWNNSSKRLLFNLGIPLLVGGMFIVLTLTKIDYSLTSALMLLFYGFSLFNGSKYTLADLRGLGVLLMITGLINVLFPTFSFWFWVFGFGILHVVYGGILYVKYDR